MERRDRARGAFSRALAEILSASLDRMALALWTVPAAVPLSYVPADGGRSWKGIDAADEDTPNETEPAEDRVILGRTAGGLSHIGILVNCSVQVVLQPWKRTGLIDEGEPGWVAVGAPITIAANAQYERVVEIGFADAYLQVVSGPAEETPLNLYVAVA